MLNLIFSEPEGLNRRGKTKWKREVDNIVYKGEKKKAIGLNDSKVPDLNYRHFVNHIDYDKFLRDKKVWEFYSQFFSELNFFDVSEIFFEHNDFNSDIKELPSGTLIKRLLQYIKHLQDALDDNTSEIENLKDSVRSLEWNYRA